MSRLLTAKEVAMRLGIRLNTLAIWRMKGCGPRFIRLGRRIIRYDPIEIDAFEKKLTRRSTSEEAVVSI